MLQIPGVSLEAYKESRRLEPAEDGHVGQLASGSATILAVIDPAVVPTICIFRDGRDGYEKQRDWLNAPRTQVQKQAHAQLLSNRGFFTGTAVYGVKVPLHVNERERMNMVNYPENMLMLAQYFCSPERDGGYILVWKVALVCQQGEFFLTAQEAYDVRLYEDERGKVSIPRLMGHKDLARLLIEHAPPELQRFPLSSFQKLLPPPAEGLGDNEGIVERWYAARNMGCIITARGPARVHYTDVPCRPRRRYLVDGEKVSFRSLGKPPTNRKTEHHKMRKSKFGLQAFGVGVGE